MALSVPPAVACPQRAQKRTGLPKPPSHRSLASQESGEICAVQPGQNAIPFLENWPNLPPVSRDPAPKVPARLIEQTTVTPQTGCNLPVSCHIASINLQVRELSI